MINDNELLNTVISKEIELENKLTGNYHYNMNRDNPQT